MPWSAPFFCSHGPSADQAQGPPLELEFVLLGQDVGFVGRGRLADRDDFDFVAVGVAQAVLDERGGELGDVDADPFAAELLGGVNGGATAAEGVENEIAGVAAGLMMRSSRASGLLGRVAQALFGLRRYGRNVRPEVRNGVPGTHPHTA